MDNNLCLEEKLKKSILDDSLIKFNHFRFNVVAGVVDADSECRIMFVPDGEVTVSVIGNGYFATSYANLDVPAQRKTSYTFNVSTTLYFKNDSYTVDVSGKYGMNFELPRVSKSILHIDFNKLGKMPKVENIIVPIGSIFDIKNAINFEKLSLIYGSQTISGDIAGLSEATTLTGLRAVYSYDNLYGDIANLGALTDLTYVDMSGSSISGSVEGFVNGQIAAGRSSVTGGTFAFNGILENCTFGGNLYNDRKNGFITWESASKIAVYYGSSTFGNCTTVYCKGYTQEEAASLWPDKTIIRVDA